MKNILFVTESKSKDLNYLSKLSKTLAEARDNHNFQELCNYTLGLPFEVDYKINSNDFIDPKYKINESLKTKKQYLDYAKIKNFLNNNSFDEIHIWGNVDCTGVYHIDLVLKSLFGNNYINEQNIKYFYPKYYSEETVKEAFNQSDESNFENKKYTSKILEFAKVKYYFDYNYNIKINKLVNPIMKELKIENPNKIKFTKYMIHLLWLLKKELIEQNSHSNRVFAIMQDGDDNTKCGTPMSRVRILENLIDLSLLDDDDKITLSKKGEAFMNKLPLNTYIKNLSGYINNELQLQTKTQINMFISKHTKEN